MVTTLNANPFSNQYLVAKGANPNYHVHIKCTGLGFEMLADMPEETSYAIAADYESQLPSSTGESAGLVGNLAAFFSGSHYTSDALSYQVWRASSPLEIPLVLLFNANTSCYEEVYKPMRLLEALAMPTTESGNAAIDYIGSHLPNSFGSLLYAPNYNNNKMSLSIGRMLNLAEVLLISCNTSYDSRLGADGFPISGKADVVFRTPKVVTRKEWMEATGVSGAQ